MRKYTNTQNTFLTDETIIELYWQREESAIKETDIKYGNFLFRIAYGVLHNCLDCEECKNDTYLGIWKAIPPTKPLNFPAFIAQIMRRIAINKYKEKSKKKAIPSNLTDSIDTYKDILTSENYASNNHNAEELGQIISNYVNTLSKRQRYIFIERFYMCESVECIASDLNISISSVYRELEKIKLGLKLNLKENDVYI